jgi:thymidylate synthase
MSYDKKYQEILQNITTKGFLEKNRTGISAYTIPSAYITHDMSDGFPLLTIRQLPYKSIRVELEGFIKGVSSKKWYKERGCKFWDEWANPRKVPYSNDPITKQKMLEEDDLGIIYGNNWRDFHDPTYPMGGEHIDQLESIVNTLKSNPSDRRMLCLSWNPLALEYAALPACHALWRVMVINNKLHLSWYQRSIDFILGFPSNMASYATLLELLSLETNIPVGIISGHLDCVHVYENHLEGANELLTRNSNTDLPTIKTDNFKSIFDWQYSDTILDNYNPQPSIKFEVAI